MKQFDIVSHTADFQLRVYGQTLPKLFINACMGMFSCIGFHSELCSKKDDQIICSDLPQQHELEIKAIDKEMLLVDFLSEALYLSDVHNEAYWAVDIHTFIETYMQATLYGVKVTRFDLEIKAVTYHDLAIKKTDIGWQVDIVFDI